MTSKDVDFKIVDLILSNGSLPKESRNDPVFHECIHELSALSIYRLSTEPSYLRDYHRRIIEENYQLAYDNYSTFIQTAECTKMIFKDFEDVEKKNEILLNKIPNFVNSCNNFVEKCRKSISIANMNSLTLKNHNQILEILEIPQLLEACIRNNYLDEALEMIAHTRKLERRHQNIGIIMNVAYESRLAAQKLLDQLFQQLGGNLQLPVCLKIVGYLRRMDCLPDSLLRMKFLQCRDNYLKNLLRSLPRNDAFFHATKYMEITRVNLFDIATQYRAVFNDDDLYVTSPDSENSHQGMLFSSWLVMRVRNFMVNLAEDLELIVQNSVDYNHANHVQTSSKSSSQSVGSKLQSLLGQSMYFGLSLSRIGCDFRALLMPMFYQAILKYTDLRLCQIPDSFSECISSYKWTVNLDEDQISNVNSVMQTNEMLFQILKSDEIVAPNKLMNHPLLAMLHNQMLSILEDIRLSCPRVLKERICQSFSNTIDKLMNSLVKFYQEESSNFSLKERQSYLAMIYAFICTLLPHINLCLSVLFTYDTGQLSNVNCALDVRRLINNFQSIMPESFFVSVLEEDLTGVSEDVVEELSKLSRSRGSSLRVLDEADQLIVNPTEKADAIHPVVIAASVDGNISNMNANDVPVTHLNADEETEMSKGNNLRTVEMDETEEKDAVVRDDDVNEVAPTLLSLSKETAQDQSILSLSKHSLTVNGSDDTNATISNDDGDLYQPNDPVSREMNFCVNDGSSSDGNISEHFQESDIVGEKPNCIQVVCDTDFANRSGIDRRDN